LVDGSQQDERIAMVVALAPVSSLFGATGIGRIQVPTVILGGAYDVAAPVVPEQVQAFQWLTTADKYFYLAEKTSHTPQLTHTVLQMLHPGIEVSEHLGEAGSWLHETVLTLLIAYGRVYLLDENAYQPYLTSAYVEAVSQEPNNLHLIQSLPEAVVVGEPPITP